MLIDTWFLPISSVAKKKTHAAWIVNVRLAGEKSESSNTASEVLSIDLMESWNVLVSNIIQWLVFQV